VARLQCTPCRSWITLLHPDECTLSTPWFPSAPAPLVLTAEHSFVSRLEVTAISCSPRGQFIAVAAGTYSPSPEFLIFDSARSQPVQRLAPHGVNSVIRSIRWIDEKTLVTGQGLLWSNERAIEVHRSLSRMPRQEPSCYGLARICSEFAVLRSLPMGTPS